MKLSLKRNESLTKLSEYTGIEINELEEKIITELQIERLLQGGYEDFGRSISEIGKEDGYTFVKLWFLIFKDYDDRYISQLILLEDIFIWGQENECPECGCGTVEDELDILCENLYCSYALSNDLDVDVMPGGKGFDN